MRITLKPVAPGVMCLPTGRGLLASNTYLVESSAGWTLVDSGWHGSAAAILAAAESLFGTGTRPEALLLTHIHPDHAGSALELARTWKLPVHVHPAELPQAAGGIVPGYENPLDRFAIAPALRLLGRDPTVGHDELATVVTALDPDGAVPGLPGWRCVPAYGHTPGSVAFLRLADRLILTGDALCTVDLNSPLTLVSPRPALSGPPWISTWSWPEACDTVARLADLGPALVASGHGRPLATSARALLALTEEMDRSHERRDEAVDWS